MSILNYQNLTLTYNEQEILHHIDLMIPKNQITVIVGQSGSGKSTLLKATMGLLSDDAKIIEGKILFEEDNLLEKDLDCYRGKKIGMIFQNPLTYFDDYQNIEEHFYESLHTHFKYSKKQSREIAIHYLKQMGLEKTILNKYPFELSGGMAQRVMIALILCLQPSLVLADEPTKGLDEQVGAVVRKNLLTIKQDLRLSMLIITHDIALAQEVCDDVLVMYAGQVLEHNADIWHKPLHPYTKGFLQALPKNGLQVIPGKAPVPGESFTGCKFAARCPYCTMRCKEEMPAMQQVGNAEVRCFLYAEG